MSEPMIRKQQFASPEEALEHHGIKGMHWGIRRSDEELARASRSRKTQAKSSESDNAIVDEYKSIAKSQPDLKGHAALQEYRNNLTKFHNKIDDPGPLLKGKTTNLPKDLKRETRAAKFDKKANDLTKQIETLSAQRDRLAPGFKTSMKRKALNNQINQLSAIRDQNLADAKRVRAGKLTSGQKKALIVAGVGAAVAGGLVYAHYSHNKAIQELEKKVASGDVQAKIKLYEQRVSEAKAKTWFNGHYIQDVSWERPEFELPEGHVFHRISTIDESIHGFNPGTYAVTNEADFNRYVLGFRGEKAATDFYHVTFSSSKPTKVPDLKTTLETLRETLSEATGKDVSRKEALSTYQSMSGGSWKDATAKKFFANLKSKGYGAIVDEMDSGVIGDRPIVFFDHENASAKLAKLMSEGELSNREKAVKLMTIPPRKA